MFRCLILIEDLWWNPLPRCSMYGISAYIWLIFMVNIGTYCRHGSYGLYTLAVSVSFNLHQQSNPYYHTLSLQSFSGIDLGQFFSGVEVSGDSWLYPYQLTPYGKSLYKSYIVGIYGLQSPRIPRCTPINTMGTLISPTSLETHIPNIS